MHYYWLRRVICLMLVQCLSTGVLQALEVSKWTHAVSLLVSSAGLDLGRATVAVVQAGSEWLHEQTKPSQLLPVQAHSGRRSLTYYGLLRGLQSSGGVTMLRLSPSSPYDQTSPSGPQRRWDVVVLLVGGEPMRQLQELIVALDSHPLRERRMLHLVLCGSFGEMENPDESSFNSSSRFYLEREYDIPEQSSEHSKDSMAIFSCGCKSSAWELLHFLWQRGVIKAAVALCSGDSMQVAWWQGPLDNDRCWSPSNISVALALLNPGGSHKVPSELSFLRGNFFSGCVLRAAAYVFPPYSIASRESTPANIYKYSGGLDIRALEEFARRKQMRVEYVPTEEDFIANGLRVETGEADVALGGYGLIEPFYALGVTCFYWMEPLMLYVPAGTPIPRWLSLVVVFSPHLWLLVASGCAAVAATLYAMRMVSAAGVCGACFHRQGRVQLPGFGQIALMLVGVSAPEPAALVPCGVFLAWLLACLVLNAAYQSALVGFLMDPGATRPVASEGEILQREMRVGTFNNLSYVTMYTDEPVYVSLAQRLVECGSVPACMRRVATRKDLVMAVDASHMEFEFRDVELRQKVRVLKTIAVYTIHMLTAHGSALLQLLDRSLTSMAECGLLGVWWQELTTGRAILSVSTHRWGASDGPRQITVADLQSAFALLGAGLLVATAVAAVELCYCHCTPKRMSSALN